MAVVTADVVQAGPECQGGEVTGGSLQHGAGMMRPPPGRAVTRKARTRHSPLRLGAKLTVTLDTRDRPV